MTESRDLESFRHHQQPLLLYIKLTTISYIVLLIRGLLLAVYVDGEDGVAPGAVLVHVVSPDRSVLQTLLSDIQIKTNLNFNLF